MREIQLSMNKVAIIDDEDFDVVNQYKWSAHKRVLNGLEYFNASRALWHKNKSKTVLMHRFILGEIPKGFEVDHINHDTLDNRRCNLRIVTKSQNSMNKLKRRACSSKYKGVYFKRADKCYCSRIFINGSHIYLGVFKSEELAALAYNEKAKELFGQYALLNVII